MLPLSSRVGHHGDGGDQDAAAYALAGDGVVDGWFDHHLD